MPLQNLRSNLFEAVIGNSPVLTTSPNTTDSMERDIRNIIDKWYKTSKGDAVEPDEFFKFIAAWIAFNSALNFRYSSPPQDRKLRDREKVEKYSETKGPNQEHKRLLENDSAYRASVEFLVNKPLTDLRTNYKLKVETTDLRDVLTLVYTVRNNLFHGGKSPTNWRDRNLVDNCSIITQCFVQYELSNSKL